MGFWPPDTERTPPFGGIKRSKMARWEAGMESSPWVDIAAAAVDTVGVPADIDIVPVAAGTVEAVPVLAEEVVVVAAATVDPVDSAAVEEAAPAVAVQESALCYAAVDLELTAVMGSVPIVSWQHRAHPSLLARSGEGASWVALGYTIRMPVFVVQRPGFVPGEGVGQGDSRCEGVITRNEGHHPDVAEDIPGRDSSWHRGSWVVCK
ncbi:uncharacterized protein N7496_002149 [Penicillium cataractarum]|uniref:Uncharacterized protein n=1 Tax=Penicillium cataractarum TaxID=2100454 RepID=A0A9W9VHL2_9EURO|nr:uncharacterized protein N7496_002149 [Penicillium cataractarum]KAJ5379721.1 hypothetical protein N7496_002149 [Penicillium cataractarum]